MIMVASNEVSRAGDLSRCEVLLFFRSGSVVGALALKTLPSEEPQLGQKEDRWSKGALQRGHTSVCAGRAGG